MTHHQREVVLSLHRCFPLPRGVRNIWSVITIQFLVASVVTNGYEPYHSGYLVAEIVACLHKETLDSAVFLNSPPPRSKQIQTTQA